MLVLNLAVPSREETPFGQWLQRRVDAYFESTTPEQRAAEWKLFKCGGCTLSDTCPSSPVCPSMED